MSQQVVVRAVSILELNEEKVAPFWALLEKEQQSYVLSHKDSRDRIRSLIGYVLASVSAKKPLPVHFEKGPYGKPFIEGGPKFSISHSGSYVVCAISNEEVGVDVQRHTEIDYLPIAERFYQKEEVKAIQEAEHPKLTFFQIWAKKEALLKCSGVGLSRDFEKIPALTEQVKQGKERFYFLNLPFVMGYSLALCGKNELEARLEWIHPDDLLKLAK